MGGREAKRVKGREAGQSIKGGSVVRMLEETQRMTERERRQRSEVREVRMQEGREIA